MIAFYRFQTIRTTTAGAQLPGRESVTPLLEQASSLAERGQGLCLEDRRHLSKIELHISWLGKSLDAFMEEVGGRIWWTVMGQKCWQ